MLTIMTTKNFLNAIDDAYAKGVCAGTMQQKLTDHEDQNRRLRELYRMGDVPEDKLYKVIEEMTKKFGDVTVKKNYDGTFDVTAEVFVSSKWKEA